MKKLNIKGGEVLIDEVDWSVVQRFIWNIHKANGFRMCIARTEKGKSRVLLHRLVMGVTGGSEVVKPVDGNYFNCQKANLRIHTRSEIATLASR